jgi:hypothetical protein
MTPVVARLVGAGLLLSPLPGLAGCAARRPAPAPAGIAAHSRADTTVHWIERSAPGFRVHFQAGSYAAAHQDSLVGRLPSAAAHARELIGAPALQGPIDLFFIESRTEMNRLIGTRRATGFADPPSRTVLVMTNAGWRAFERHEIMHVVAGQAWGPAAPGTDWLVEGLAQAADGFCAGHPNEEVAWALARRHGWIPLRDVLTRFRAQPDLRAYLQAASFTAFLLREAGADALRGLWHGGATLDTRLAGHTLAELDTRWRADLSAQWIPEPGQLERIEAVGCGEA